MLKRLGRLLAFCAKETNEIVRQPKLVLSLLLGPSLILLVFGIGYQSGQPRFDTLLVVPANPPADYPIADIQRVVNTNFHIVDTVHDREAALARLHNGDVKVVEAWPDAFDKVIVGGKKVSVEFYSNELNPLNQGWIQYLAYAQISAVNTTLLTNLAARNQSEAGTTQQFLQDAKTQIEQLRTGVAGAQQVQNLDRLEQLAGVLAASAAITDPQTRTDLLQLQSDLHVLRQAQEQGQLALQQDRLEQTARRIDSLEQVSGTFATIPPDVLVSPLDYKYQSLARINVDAMTFYAPAVLALLIQHIAVALGALSLVRERLLGSLEFFRVAPVTPLQMLLGKYLGYLIFIAAIIAVLTLLLVYGLGVPFLGSVWWFILESLLLVLASLGVGFTISAISSTDSQAVQFSMLVLLLSIFFAGFFLPLDSFLPQVRIISYVLPLTHGIVAFQSELLSGQLRTTNPLLGLGIIAAVMFITALLFTTRQFRRI